ncbi:MAG TPA: PDZ domain-containing protein [Clostridiales bacterium]|nr:PDZ domain-containing protein [Clostridiales bacterium]
MSEFDNNNLNQADNSPDGSSHHPNSFQNTSDQFNSTSNQFNKDPNQAGSTSNQFYSEPKQFNNTSDQFGSGAGQLNSSRSQLGNSPGQYTGYNYYNGQNSYQSQYGNRGQYGTPGQENSQNPYGGQSQYNKQPEYSFQAEQAQNRSYYNYNQNNGSWDYNNQNTNQNYYYTNPNYNSANQGSQDNPGSPSGGKRKKERKAASAGGRAVKFMAKAVCFGLIAGLSFTGFEKLYFTIDPGAASNAILKEVSDNYTYEVGYTKTGTVKKVSETAVSNIAKDTLPAIVSINSTSSQPMDWFGRAIDQEVEGSGSGIIVGKNEKELLIATNNHVVEGTKTITVTFADGSKADAIIKGTDPVADLAVVTVDITKLKADTLSAITVAKLGDSDDIQVGEMVIAIGNALGYGQSVTVGYVSAKDREVEVSDGYTTKKMVLLQTDAAINPGNSGGALINMQGEVIGINTVKYASSEVEGMGYAIPITKATPIITELMSREILSEAEQGYLGISGSDVTEEVAAYYNMPVGVYIKEAVKDGAAEKAGLRADDIITKADDIEISSISQLKEYVNSRRVGTKVTITYMRNTSGTYEEGKVTVTLGKNPSLTN